MDSCSNSLTLRENPRSANFNVDCPHVDPALTVLTQRTVACAKRRCHAVVVLVAVKDFSLTIRQNTVHVGLALQSTSTRPLQSAHNTFSSSFLILYQLMVHEMDLSVCHVKPNPSSPPLLHVPRPPKNT